jgi:hypothetical protein
MPRIPCPSRRRLSFGKIILRMMSVMPENTTTHPRNSGNFSCGYYRRHSYSQEHKSRRRFNLSVTSEKRELANTVMDGDYECAMT